MMKSITDSKKTYCFGFCLLSQKLLFWVLLFLILLHIVGLEAIRPWYLGILAAILGINYLASSFEFYVMRGYFVHRFYLREPNSSCCIVMWCPICAASQMHSELEYQKNKPEFNLYPYDYYFL